MPRNCSSAGTKSHDDRPCRYSSGSTSVIFGDLRHHAGRIAEANRCRSPVTSSTRLSLTRGAATSHRAGRGEHLARLVEPLRTTSRRPCSSSSPASAAMYAATSASNAAASIRRAPSRTISSINDDRRRVRRRRSSGVGATGNYGEHGRTFPTRVGARALLDIHHGSPGRYAPQVIHRFQALLMVRRTDRVSRGHGRDASRAGTVFEPVVGGQDAGGSAGLCGDELHRCFDHVEARGSRWASAGGGRSSQLVTQPGGGRREQRVDDAMLTHRCGQSRSKWGRVGRPKTRHVPVTGGRTGVTSCCDGLGQR